MSTVKDVRNTNIAVHRAIHFVGVEYSILAELDRQFEELQDAFRLEKNLPANVNGLACLEMELGDASQKLYDNLLTRLGEIFTEAAA